MTDMREKLQAALGQQYAIERQAGEGGMATVFLANDLKHGRRVAIKVLRPELGATIGTDRFLREIELAAKLQHPHIVPVYDSGAADGVLYYVMPFVEGESLRERLRREGALPLEEAQRLLQEIASALGYAHQRGIVHRDIKPENILLSGGHAVVADFGIARALEAGGTQNLTGFGMAIGTPAYMSPEQATASDDVDARSDQYALACVYYEMLTGRPPFTGNTAQAVMAQSLTGPRPKATAHRQGLPSGVDAALARGLAREPEERYATVGEFAEAATKAAAGRRLTAPLVAGALAVVLALAAGAWWLGRSTAGSPVAREAERIAVLPFQWSGAGEDVLGEGMVNLLAANLDAVGGISVVEPSRVLAEWRKRGQGFGLEEALAVGRAMDAEAVVHGTIVGVGGTLRLNAALVAKDGRQLGTARLEGPADSVLGLVDRLSVALLRSVWQSNEPVPSLRVAALTTTSVPALRAYLDGERHYRRAEWDSAAAAFEGAVAEDSTFALAHYRLALTLGWAGSYAGPRAAQATAAAARYADRLPAKERGLLVGYQLFADRDPAAADTLGALARANPNDPDAWYLLGEARMHSRSTVPWSVEEIVQPFDRVLALDSTLTPAVIHPVELALATRDSVRFGRYMTVLAGAATTSYAENFRNLGRFVWDEELTDAERGAIGASGSGGFFAMNGLKWAPTVTPARLERLFDAMITDNPNPGLVREAAIIRGFLMLGLGQLGRAKAYGDSLRGVNPQAAQPMAIAPYLLGVAPAGWNPELLARFDRAPNDGVWMAAIKAVVRMQQGQAGPARHLADSMLALRDTDPDPRFGDFFRAVRGWAKVEAGDTTDGLADLRAGLRPLGEWNNFLTGPVRLAWARTLATRPATREQGIALLRLGFDNDIGLLGRVMFEIGRAEEQAGRRALAAEAYGQFVRLWADADPALRPTVDSARTALLRVTGEPPPS